MHRAQGRLHDAAGGPEDEARTGGAAERIVEVGLGQRGHVESGLAEHRSQLAGGEAEVDVLIAAGVHLRPVAFELLGRAGHDGHADDVLAGSTPIFSA